MMQLLQNYTKIYAQSDEKKNDIKSTYGYLDCMKKSDKMGARQLKIVFFPTIGDFFSWTQG